MIKRVSGRILRISFLVSFCAHGILFSQGTQNQTPFDAAISSEHIWDISDESPNFTRESIQEIIHTNPSPKIEDSPALKQGFPSDWEIGWDIDFEGSSGKDIETFFPISSPEDEGTCRLDDLCTQETSDANQGTSKTQSRHTAAPLLFSFGLEEEITEEQIGRSVFHQILQQDDVSFFGNSENDEWTDNTPPPRTPGDISNATNGGTSFFLKEEKKKKNQINFGHLETKEEEEKSNTSSPSKTLGKKRVSVEPFSAVHQEQEKPVEKSQILSSKRNPYFKFAPAKSNQTLIGPFLTENEPSSKNKSDREEEDVRNSGKKRISLKQSPESIIAQVVDEGAPLPPSDMGQVKTPPKTILIKFNNVNVVEYLRFISRLTNKNFIFDQNDLDFNVTIISEEPTTLDNVITALIQELRIHGLQLIEEGNNFIIHKNDDVKAIGPVNVEGAPTEVPRQNEIITQVFTLNTLSPSQAQKILSPMLSKDAIMGTADETRHIILTDLVSNIQQVEKLLKSIDAPASGMVLGQYVVRNAFMDNLIELAQRIMEPIAQDQKLTLVPHPAAKSIFIVSSPFIVERTISVLQHLDNFQGTTRIFDLHDLKFEQISPPEGPAAPVTAPSVAPPGGVPPEGAITPKPTPGEREDTGKWELNPEGRWIFRPGFPTKAPSDTLPQGMWQVDPQGNWYFAPEGAKIPFKKQEAEGLVPGETPKGRWLLDPQGSWIFQLTPGEAIKPERLRRRPKVEEELPVGHIDRTKFYIYKLQFRRGEDIVSALQKIADSIQGEGSTNADLISSILSAQWLEASNSIIITGTDISIEKVRELIEEIDRPLRQVLIEMLVLETTLDDSLTYGVSWGTKSGGGNTATAQAFIGGASALVPAMATSGIVNGVPLIPNASNVATTLGYNLGVIGQRITHHGTQFASLAALVQAVHRRGDTNIVINPKIITEDNKTAEIFVGVNSPFLTNSIANDQGSIITTNVEFRDTGTTLRVTPLIGNGDIITLEIEQEVSRTAGTPITGGEIVTTPNLTPTTSINRTTTTVHVPDKYFVVISGMIQDEKIDNYNQFPCLGGIPILGAGFKINDKQHLKRNLMIFIRPEIVDNSAQFLDITRRQQQIFKQKNRNRKMWKYEVDEALEFMNIKPPCCDECE